jgi:hypothetical protein
MYHFCWDLTVIYSVSEIFRDDIVTKQEFDEVYFQAREVLYRRGTVVGRPTICKDGARRCPVNGASLIDRDLLKEAWGERLTDEILAELAESETIPVCCVEFERLWHAYTLATRRYLRVFADQQISRYPSEQARLTPMLREASKTRSRLRQAVREHGTAHRTNAA